MSRLFIEGQIAGERCLRSLRSNNEGDIREYIGKGDDPIEAYKDAEDNEKVLPI